MFARNMFLQKFVHFATMASAMLAQTHAHDAVLTLAHFVTGSYIFLTETFTYVRDARRK
jgi:hypothetical protein